MTAEESVRVWLRGGHHDDEVRTSTRAVIRPGSRVVFGPRVVGHGPKSAAYLIADEIAEAPDGLPAQVARLVHEEW